MPNIPGLKSDVFFGATDKLPNWREELTEEHDEDEVSDEERKAISGMIGFDTSELTESTEKRR